MKSVDSSHDPAHDPAHDRDRETHRTEPVDSPARLPRRIARQAAAGTPARAPTGADTQWTFGAAVSAGIHGPIARAADGGELSGGAGAAVTRAAGSSGAALPSSLQHTFERSLGTDLSSVRVHTGAASADAASSVAARAYAVGQDIHFAAGQYDPGSAAGQHLIAHEVAHTVQQRGAAPSAQYKLEVTAPGDHCEVEADTAADAMVRGAPASVSAAGAVLGRAIMRTPSTDLDRAATRGETVEREALRVAPPSVSTVTNVQDITQAQRIYDEIETDLPHLMAGNEAGNSYLNSALGIDNTLVTPAQINETENVRTALSTYMASAGEQSRELGDFQRQYQQCIVDFSRIQAMIEQFQTTHPEVAGGATNSGAAAAMGDSVVRSATGHSTAESADRARSLAVSRGGGAFNDAFNDYRGRRTELDTVSREIGQCQRNASAQQHNVLHMIDEIQAGPVTRGEAGTEERHDLSALRAQCETVKTWVRRVTTASASRAQSVMTAAGAPGAVASAITDHLDDAGDLLVDAAYEAQIQTLQAAVGRADTRASSHGTASSIEALRGAMGTWHANLLTMMNAVERMRLARSEMRTSTDMLSRAADASGHGDIAVLTRMTGECDVFLSQARMTIQLGRAEQSSATTASADRGTANAMTYYHAIETYSMGQVTYQAVPRHVLIAGNYGARSAEGTRGVNPTVDAALAELQRFESIVSGFNGRVGRAAGLGDGTSGAPDISGVADPSMRSATGDPDHTR